MSTQFKNIMLIGATGRVGAPILAALLSDPSFSVTILSRASSSAKFPSGIPVTRVSDDFTTEELTQAFKGQDAVVVATSSTPALKSGIPFHIIDAAIAAGVKRLIPSEFGNNNLDPRATSSVPVYEIKGKMLQCLIKKASASNGALTWTSVATGAWIDWALDSAKSGDFLGVNIGSRKATIWDSGLSRFAANTLENIGIAVAKILLHPDLTSNKQVFLAGFSANVREVVASAEKLTGEKFTIEERRSGPVLKELRERFDAGDFDATYELLSISFVSDVDQGYDFEKEQEVWNKKLGVPETTLNEVVRSAIELAKSAGA